MIHVNCPQCSTQFRVPDHAIPPAGRTLRCSSCRHTWHFVLNDDRAILPHQSIPPSSLSDAPSFLQNTINTGESFSDILQKTGGSKGSIAPLPVKNKRPSILKNPAALRGYAACALLMGGLIWIFLSGQFVITTLAPRFQSVYDMMGMKVVIGQPDFMFLDVQTKFDPDTFTIAGNFKNNTRTQKTTPPIRAQIFGNDQSAPLALWVFRPAEKYLNPGQMVPFTLTRDFTDGDIAHRLDLQVIPDVVPTKTE